MEATSTFSYSGPLLLLASGISTATGALPVRFSLPAGYSANENTSCFVDLIFIGRNANAGVGEGYSDTQRLSLQFFIPSTPPPVVNTPVITPENFSITSKSSTDGEEEENQKLNEQEEIATITPPVVASESTSESETGEIQDVASSTPEINF